jgi:hypothetical protein
MLARTLALLAVMLVIPAHAEGPGTRLRTTPEVPQAVPPIATPTADAIKSCERLDGERRERCLARLAEAQPGRRSSGPEATGMGSGAGVGATSGTSGNAGTGASAPR